MNEHATDAVGGSEASGAVCAMIPLLPADGSVVMFMVVRTPSGGPMGYPMTLRCRGDRLEITTYRKAAKARSLLADPRLCCVVLDEDRPGRAVRIFGRARPSDDTTGFRTTDASSESAIEVPDDVRSMVSDRLDSAKRMVFVIDVVRWDEIGEVI